jgi:hypothetical protein
MTHDKATAAERAWHGRTVDQLAELSRSGERFLKGGKSDQAVAGFEKGEPLVSPAAQGRSR